MSRWRAILAGLLGPRPRPLQAGALCLRQGKQGTEVLLVTSLDTGRLIIPKGWPMTGRSLAGAALQEAWEEAGVHGRLIGSKPVGQFRYGKRRKGGLVQEVEMLVFAVEVESLDTDFPEAGRRKLSWLSPEAAAGRVEEPGLAAILRRL